MLCLNQHEYFSLLSKLVKMCKITAHWTIYLVGEIRGHKIYSISVVLKSRRFRVTSESIKH